MVRLNKVSAMPPLPSLAMTLILGDMIESVRLHPAPAPGAGAGARLGDEAVGRGDGDVVAVGIVVGAGVDGERAFIDSNGGSVRGDGGEGVGCIGYSCRIVDSRNAPNIPHLDIQVVYPGMEVSSVACRECLRSAIEVAG